MGPNSSALRPGIVLFSLGLGLTIPLTFAPIRLGPITFSVFWMLLGMSLTIVGLQSFYMGCLSRILHDFTGDARRCWYAFFSYDRSILLSRPAIDDRRPLPPPALLRLSARST